MNILELGSSRPGKVSSPDVPFVFKMYPGAFQLADFWTVTFGFVDYSETNTTLINAFIRDFSVSYIQVSSYAECVAQEKSFYWDNGAQELFYHVEHEYSQFNALFEIGEFQGFNDYDTIYIDDIEYSPILKSIPSVAQQQDIINYDKLSFMSGSAVLENGDVVVQGITAGNLDRLIADNVYGNQVFTYYLDEALVDEDNFASREDMVRLGSFYIEDYDISLKEITLRLQDPRKGQDVSIPNTFFNSTDYPNIGDVDGDVIPNLQGQVREAKAIITNEQVITGDVEYRVCLLLTTLGTVQVDIDGLWVTKSTASTSLSTGEFTLSSTDGRDANGKARDCRVQDPIGTEITYSTDIIKNLNLEYLGVVYLESTYDTTEWEAEEVSLSTAGVLYDSQVKLYDAIKDVQNGSSVGFRYESNPDGRRTIRIDDNDRAISGHIENIDMQNNDEMPVTTNSKQVFAEVRVKYAKSYNSGKSRTVTDDDYSQQVLEDYNSLASLPVDTILYGQTEAETRAASDALRFSTIPNILTSELKGKGFLTVRIFDIKTVEVTPGFVDADTEEITGREFYGIKKGKILSVDPDPKNLINTVTVQLLEE